MRPIGSWLFGRIADRHGRKKSMIISICLMALSSFLFAALPTYDQVGLFALFYCSLFVYFKAYQWVVNMAPLRLI